MSNSRLTLAVFLILLLFTLYLTVQLFWVFVTPIVLALVLVSIFNPFYNRLVRILWGNRYLAATAALLVIILCVSLPFSFFISQLSRQAFEFYQSKSMINLLGSPLSQFSSQHPLVMQIQGLAEKLDLPIPAEKIVTSISSLMSSFGMMLYDRLSEVASNALFIAYNFAITMMLVFMFFVMGSDLKKYLMDISPLPEDEKEFLVSRFSEISKAVFLGNGFVAFLEGVLGGLGFYMFDLGPAFFWGLVLGLSAFLPVVGTWIIVLPATLVLVGQNRVGEAWAYFFYNVAYLIVCELIIKPKLIAGKSRVNIVLVLLSVLGGVHLFGVLGLFYGPLVVTMFLTLVEIYREHYRQYL